jgi:hypothetical protein
MITHEKDYAVLNTKSLRHPNNKQFVTARVNIINNRKVINFSIGTDVCDEINFHANDRIHILMHRENRNYIIFHKTSSSFDGYKLFFNDKKNSSFLTFAMRYDSPEAFKLSQTVILDYDCSNNMLLIDLEKLK